MAKKQPNILFDKTELVLRILGDHPRSMNVTYDKIMSIVIEPCEEKKLFKKVPSEEIIIKLRMDPENPIRFVKSIENDFFDGYKTSLAKFAKDNKLSFVDSTQ